jgi:hypothetical protein
MDVRLALSCSATRRPGSQHRERDAVAARAVHLALGPVHRYGAEMRATALAPFALALTVPCRVMALTDAGAADGGACGAVTAQGSCNGNVVSYCDTNIGQAVTYDCTMRFSTSSRCIEIDPAFGFRCAEAVGSDCFIDDHGTPLTLFCQGQNAGCLEKLSGVTCTENLGPCTPGQIGSCQGDRLLQKCNADQPYFVDCASYGGTCSNRRCVDIPAGGLCDDQTLICADTSRCMKPVCIPLGHPDASEPALDAGADGGPTGVDGGASGPGDGKSGCSCSGNIVPPPPRDRLAIMILLAAIVGCTFFRRGAHAPASRTAKAERARRWPARCS